MKTDILGTAKEIEYRSQAEVQMDASSLLPIQLDPNDLLNLVVDSL